MEQKLASRITHRDFLKMCGLAIVGAGAGQVVAPPQRVSAAYDYANLNVSGSVGIGTDTPAADALLHVRGANKIIKVQSSGTDAQMVLQNDAVTRAFGITDFGGGRDSFRFHNNAGANYVVIDVNGNVGIGTTIPAYPLDVFGDARVYSRFRFSSAVANGGNQALIALDSGVGAGKQIGIYSYANGRTVATFDCDSGNVGIGTSSPSFRLTIDNSSNSGDHLELADVTHINHGMTDLLPTDAFLAVGKVSGGGGGTYLRSANAIAANQPLWISGVFGVTNPNPGVAAILLNGAKKADSGNGVQALGSGEMVFEVRNGYPASSIRLLTILGNGYVGVGTSTPSDRLQVAGNVIVNGEVWVNSALAITSSGVATQAYYAQ